MDDKLKSVFSPGAGNLRRKGPRRLGSMRGAVLLAQLARRFPIVLADQRVQVGDVLHHWVMVKNAKLKKTY